MVSCISIIPLPHYVYLIEERVKLRRAIINARATLSNSEKISGKWNKDEKSKVTALCHEKGDWLDKSQMKDTQLEDIQQQMEDFEQRIEPFLNKLSV